MNYINEKGQQSNHGIKLGELIATKAVGILDGMHNIKNKNDYLVSLFYSLCHNEELLYQLHKQYCIDNNIYPKCKIGKDVPFSPKLRNQVFQIMVCVLNYEITKYKIINSKFTS